MNVAENLLIVDDQPDNLPALATVLREQGYVVRKALSGAAALESAHRQRPDLILLDLTLRQMDGYELCSRLKTAMITREVPVIFLSGLGDAADKVKAFAVGADDYMTKPFQVEEMLVRVRQQLTLQWQRQQLQQEIQKRKQIEEALRQANLELQRLVNLDGLTQVANRRCFDEALHREWKRLRRERSPVSLILGDVDCFKAYNDYYGHPMGDRCLKRIAQAIAQNSRRPADVVARYGGEEFAVILPNTLIEGAICVAQHIQATVAKLAIPHAKSSVCDRVSLSLGIACAFPTEETTPEGLIVAADQALYIAKASGRDRYCIGSKLARR